MDIEILYQDQDIVVIQKPAGVVANDAQTVKGQTIQGWFRRWLKQNRDQIRQNWEKLVPADFDDQYGTPEEIFDRRDGLAHRLDRDTSGVLLLATNPASLVHLLAQFKQRHIQKKYRCLVHGSPKVDSAEIDAPIARSKVDRHQFWVDIDGKSAKTFFKVVKKYKGFDWERLRDELNEFETHKLDANLDSYQHGFSLVECFPKTGRTHQIRVHMRHIGHPLVTDQLYGGQTRSRLDSYWCPRQFLHAYWIKFTHPSQEKNVHIKAPLAPDLLDTLGLLI